MIFTSTVFLFGFLPIVLLGNILLKKKIAAQNFFLLGMSLVFYAWGEPKYIALMLFSCCINWGMAIVIEKCKNRKWRGVSLVVALAINIGMLLVCKYLNWGIGMFNHFFGLSIPVTPFRLPVGISFYTFQALSYIIDVWCGRIKAQKSLINIGLYISLFPQLVAGPIVRYVDIEQKLFDRKITAEDTSEGIFRFLTGFCKKVLLADIFSVIADKAFALNGEASLGTAMAWLGAISYTLQIYYDFSGYSDMAIGLGKMLGFQFGENFNYPYMANSVSDFWRRWHISLGNWFRDYVYIPLGGNRKGKARTIINLMITWCVTGVWHGANLTFVLWGFIYGILILIEKIFSLPEKVKGVTAKVAYHGFVIFTVVLCWVIFRADNVSGAFQYISVMFGLESGVNDLAITGLYFREHLVELILGVVFSFPILPAIKKKDKKTINWITDILLYVCFIVAISYLIKGTYSPFIYFNF